MKTRILSIVALLFILSSAVLTINQARANSSSLSNIKHVWFIMFENHSWSDIQGSTSAPYINNTLLPQSAYSTNHFDPSYGHPSLAAYIDLEAGNNMGISNDNYPNGPDKQSTTSHFVTQLTTVGYSWRGYIEGIPGNNCPLVDVHSTHYAVRHNPQMYFSDVTSSKATCVSHERPLPQLAADLKNSTEPNYSYILPNLCHDMHTTCASTGTDQIKAGDAWLSTFIPNIMASNAYKQDGAIFISWDEGTDNGVTDSDGPIGLIVLSPFAKAGYASSVLTSHNSTLLTMEEIYGVTPLRDAANATDLSDMFQ